MSEQVFFDEGKVRKSSHKSALTTLLGALIIGVAFIASLWQLGSLNTSIDEKRALLDSLKIQAEFAARQIDILRENRKELEASYEVVNKAIASTRDKGLQRVLVENTPLVAVLKPRAAARPVEAPAGGEGQYYAFEIWLDSPRARRNEIAEVRYELNHPTFRQKMYSSSNPNDGFRVGYTGWGCLRSVIMTVVLKQGEPAKLEFDMCAELGWVAAK